VERGIFSFVSQRRSRLGRLFRLFTLTALGVGGLLAYEIWSYQQVRDESAADVAIVMGAAVWGSEPSPAFVERIEHAIVLYQRGRVGQLLFTGGVGKGQRFSEAEVARRHAIERGVRPEHILIEDRSTTSRENLENAKRLLDQHELRTAIIVTEPLHMKRSMAIAEAVGLHAQPSPTPDSPQEGQWREAWMLARESFFLGHFFVEYYAEQWLGKPPPRDHAARASL